MGHLVARKRVFDVFVFMGMITFHPSAPYTIPVSNIDKPSLPSIGEEELRKRIQGFGPSGSSEKGV